MPNTSRFAGMICLLVLATGCAGKIDPPVAAADTSQSPSGADPAETPASAPSFSRAETAFIAAVRKDPDALVDDDTPQGLVDEGRAFCRLDGNHYAGAHADDLKSMIVARIFMGTLQREAVRYLCPKYVKTWLRAMRGFKDGEYTVGKTVKPGTYRTLRRPTKDCYWERSTGGGDTIANAFVTNAPAGVTVTVSASDGGFTSRGCGIWAPL